MPHICVLFADVGSDGAHRFSLIAVEKKRGCELTRSKAASSRDSLRVTLNSCFCHPERGRTAESKDPCPAAIASAAHRRFKQFAPVALTILLVGSTAFAMPVAKKKQLARTQFENAERMREALNGRPTAERTRREYQKVMDAFRRVYYLAPTSSKADSAVVAVAELLAESGRHFEDQKVLTDAIRQYEFLRREYPGSKYRVDALFTIGQIYREDLDDTANARATFEEFLKHYPRSSLSDDATKAIAEMDQEAREAASNKQTAAQAKAARKEKAQENRRPLVTGIRHWSTPDYTRVAIDLEQDVTFDSERIDNPDRIYFDLHNTKLSSVLVGKTFDVEDGFLHRIRIAQFQPGETRVVLEVDNLSDYSAFLLPNPYRLVVDIHGKPTKGAASAAKAVAPVAVETARQEPPKPEIKASAPRPQPPRPEPMEIAAGRSRLAPPTEPPPAVQMAESSPPTLPQPSTAKPVLKTESAPKPAPTPAASIGGKAEVAGSKPEGGSKTEVASIKKSPDLTDTTSGKRAKREAVTPPAHEATPLAQGDRSLIRALGLKIGRIVVDAGHGGHDTGTIGPNNLLEKDLVLDVALRLGKLLTNRLGADVVYTRDDDTFVPLETRTAIANQNEADLFISIHANSSRDPSARGVETYYLNFTSSADALEVAARENAVSEKSIHELQDLVKKIALKEKIEESREFAADVQHSLYTGIANRGLRDRGVKKAPFIVLIGANMPSILAVISFVSNPADAKKLQTPEYRQKIAESLYRGIAKYVGGLSGVKVASKGSKSDGQ